MNDCEILKDWHRRHLNETLDEHDMQMDSSPPWNVLAALHRENEREEESAMLPTSRSSSNGGHENAVGTALTTHHGGRRNTVGSAHTVGGKFISAPP